MKLQNVNEQIAKLNLKAERKEAILNLIDLKVDNETSKTASEIKAINFKVNVLTWSIVVIVLGFLSKIILGAF